MDIQSSERISMEAEQYAMQQQQQQQQPIQYINVDRDSGHSGHSGSNNESTFAPDNVQGNQQCASTMVTIQDHPSMAMDQQYTNDMSQMNDVNQQQQQQQQHVIHDDQNAAQNLISSNEIRIQSTLGEYKA